MIIGIGCDIVDHEITSSLEWPSDSNTLPTIFSDQELESMGDKESITFLSGRFAVKEAVLKCLGTGMQDDISLTDIRVLPLEDGKPVLYVGGKVKQIADKLGIRKWHVTITHSTTHSLAFVIAET